jgi:hypothetical protein
MSQSDYIRHKKMANILKHQENLGNVINSQDLTNFRTFELSNTIYDNSVTYNQILPGNKQNIFNMEMEISVNCPNVVFCTNTNNRPNRSLRPLPMFSHYRGKISKNGYFWDQKTKNKLCLEKEFKECDSFLYRRNIWFKK